MDRFRPQLFNKNKKGAAVNEYTYCNCARPAFKQFDAVGKLHYKEKLGMLRHNNRSIHYLKRCLRSHPFSLDICAYPIHTPDLYTKEAFKTYKSTEAWFISLLAM